MNFIDVFPAKFHPPQASPAVFMSQIGTFHAAKLLDVAKEDIQEMYTILLIILILLLIGALPSWPYSRGWGYYPSGGLGLVLLIIIILLLLRVI